MKKRTPRLTKTPAMVQGRMLALFVVVVSIGGCAQSPLITNDYGTQATSDARVSVNGTSVFADIFQRRGNHVVADRRITPRVERFGAIVWFAAKDSECPDPEVATRINTWLGNDSRRKLLYVGWDADAATGFWNDATRNATGKDAESLMRRRAWAMADADGHDGASRIASASCDWFQTKIGERKKLDRMKNRAGKSIDVSGGTVEIGTVRLMPPSGKSSNVILRTDDGVPFAFSTVSNNSVFRSNVVVVSNSSFLLNYSLLNPTNRKLATEVLDEIGTVNGPVLFLHSGDVTYSDSVYEKQTAWSWVNQPPVRYIVPHILAIGLIFVFSVFPVLGRPRALEKELQPGLGRHVDAVGELIVRSGRTVETENWLRAKMAANRSSKTVGAGKRAPGQ